MWALGGIAGLILWIGAVNGLNVQTPTYAPQVVPCRAGSLVTSTGSPLAKNQFLESREAAYQAVRWNKVLEPLYSKYLGNGQDTGYSTAQLALIVKHEPRTGIACSGGGLRASLYCAGTLSALDSRSKSHAAPVLQLAAYMTGLSGGSWAITSLATSNLGPTSIYDIVMGRNGAPGWKLDLNLLFPSFWHALPLNQNIWRDLSAKTKAGFSVTLIDYWGRMLGHHFLPGTWRADFFSSTALNSNSLLFDAIKSTSNFAAFKMPYPIAVTTSRVKPWDQFKALNDYIPAINTVFEISPYSFGSFEPSLSAHMPTEYMGSYVEGDQTTGRRVCVKGYDSASFIMGCSAGLFTAVESMLRPNTKTLQKILNFIHRAAIKREQTDFLTSRVPNTFRGYSPHLQGSRPFESTNNEHLYLTDGGMNGENIPLSPLLVKARRVDTIFAIDASQDTKKSWPNGRSLRRTLERIRLTANGYTDFPPVPTTAGYFLKAGLTSRPVFFGCDVGDARVENLRSYPIILYLPNAAVPNSRYSTNTETMQMAYTVSDTEAFLDTAHANAMKGHPLPGVDADPQYGTAVKCAIVDRARQRARIKRSPACQKLMQRYCWSS